eukprot:1720107-Amphidinium_carterae.1
MASKQRLCSKQSLNTAGVAGKAVNPGGVPIAVEPAPTLEARSSTDGLPQDVEHVHHSSDHENIKQEPQPVVTGKGKA